MKNGSERKFPNGPSKNEMRPKIRVNRKLLLTALLLITIIFFVQLQNMRVNQTAHAVRASNGLNVVNEKGLTPAEIDELAREAERATAPDPRP